MFDLIDEPDAPCYLMIGSRFPDGPTLTFSLGDDGLWLMQYFADEMDPGQAFKLLERSPWAENPELEFDGGRGGWGGRCPECRASLCPWKALRSEREDEEAAPCM